MHASEREELRRRMVRLAAGDRRELRPVFDLVWPIVRRFAERSLAHGGSVADAEDVAQTALISVFDRVAEYDPERDALAWILAVTAWQVRTAKRKIFRRREDAGVDLESLGSRDASDIESALIERELEAAAKEVLGTLRPEDRETILAATDPTRRPAINAATFRKRVQRATERLREAWRTRHGTE